LRHCRPLALAPLISTPLEETGFPFPTRLNAFDGRMPEDLVNAKQFDVEDGCNGEILAPLNC
jgi:hypothetical protein